MATTTKAMLVLASCLFLFGQAPQRDTSAKTGTGTIRGRVVSATTGEPLHRVRVTVNIAVPNPPSAVTDTRGEFEITEVPVGTHSLTAARAGYLTIQYGQRQPREAGRMIEVRAGRVTDGIDIALPRGAALSGFITDDTNDYYPGVSVEALEFRYIRGRRVLVQAASAITNDLGQFRIGGLPPGLYFLRASTTDTWDSADGKATYTYATTYYPGVTGSDQAQSVNVNTGQELSNLDFSVRPGPTARIHGVMQDAAGEPIASQAVSVSPINRGAGGALVSNGGPTSRMGRTDRSGAFDFPNLPPGEYLIVSGGESDRSATSVIVSDGDTRSIVLAPRKPTSLIGNIVTDEGVPPKLAPAILRVIPVPADGESLFPLWTDARDIAVARDWTFRWTNIDGHYVFRVSGLPNDWMLAAVTFNGRNVTDAPLNVPPGGIEVKGLQIVLSQKGGKVEGDVVGDDGRPTPECTVVIFAADSARWTSASRYIKAVRPDSEGRFIVGGLPPGVYRVVARGFVAEGQWEDPTFLTSVSASAVPIKVVENGSEKLSLKLEPPR